MLLLLLCLSAVVGRHGDGGSVAAIVKAMVVKQEEQAVASKPRSGCVQSPDKQTDRKKDT